MVECRKRYTKGKKPDTNEYILYHLIYIKLKKKNLICSKIKAKERVFFVLFSGWTWERLNGDVHKEIFLGDRNLILVVVHICQLCISAEIRVM